MRSGYTLIAHAQTLASTLVGQGIRGIDPGTSHTALSLTGNELSRVVCKGIYAVSLSVECTGTSSTLLTKESRRTMNGGGTCKTSPNRLLTRAAQKVRIAGKALTEPRPSGSGGIAEFCKYLGGRIVYKRSRGDGAGYGYGVSCGGWGREKSGDCLFEEPGERVAVGREQPGSPEAIMGLGVQFLRLRPISGDRRSRRN